MNTNSIEIVSIPELHRTQGWVDGETVARYMQAIQNGETLEPVGCARCPLSGNIILNDGHIGDGKIEFRKK